LRWAANTLTTNGVMRSTDITVVSIVDTAEGPAVGVVSRTIADPGDVDAVVEASEAAARQAPAAPDAAPLTAGEQSTAWGDEPGETDASVFSAFAPALGEVFGAARSQGRELFGFAEHVVETTYLGTSEGIRARHVQPTGKVEVTGKSANRTRSTWIGKYTEDFTDVDVVDLDADISRRLGWAERQIALDAGRYDVVLPPSALADLMIYLYWSSAARDAAEGRTVFSRPGGGTRVGERLSELPVSLLSDPAYPGMHCEPFVTARASSSSSSVFDNGIPLRRTHWVRDGTLEALLQTRASAALTDLPLTPAIDNLAFEVKGASGTLDQVIATVDNGLLLTTLWYIREVDPQTLLLTGLTRDGVYLIEKGEVVGAVNNFRFNESPFDLLSRVEHAGTTGPSLPREWSDFFQRVSMPPVRVAGFNMSTVSQAS
jgi:predicted Zn-dependent protease